MVLWAGYRATLLFVLMSLLSSPTSSFRKSQSKHHILVPMQPARAPSARCLFRVLSGLLTETPPQQQTFLLSVSLSASDAPGRAPLLT
jgi:hypothetical protein